MFVALIIQDAKRMFRILLSSVARLALPYFFDLIMARFSKKVHQHKTFVLISSTTLS
jgi:hypothetical protein